MESVIEAFTDAARSLGLHAIEVSPDPVVAVETAVGHVEEENAA